MGTRLDFVLQKYPNHAEEIRLSAARDPSKNLKYLDWSAQILASGQALAPEIADVVDLFHEFKGRLFAQGRRHERIHPDIYHYRTRDFTKLRDDLRRMKRSNARKRRARERLYRIDGAIEADVVYDSDDLVVRHIKNKNASVHYGLSTKWCIAMLREHYFEDYETQNSTFFFFERKTRLNDEYDKVALVIPRDKNNEYDINAHTSLDRRIGVIELADVHGSRVFDIARLAYERSLQHPHSTLFLTYRGIASAEQLEAVFEQIGKTALYEMRRTLEVICCNDAAPFTLLKKIAAKTRTLVYAASRKNRSKTRSLEAAKKAEKDVRAALAIHPATPDDERADVIKALRRSRVNINSIRRSTKRGDMVGVEYTTPSGPRSKRKRWDRPSTARGYVKLAEMMDRRAARYRKKAGKLAEKEAKRKAR
jgi:hypothetical protein